MSDPIDKIAVPLVGDEPDGYREWLGDVKARVHAAQQRAAMAVNQELLSFYWQLGRDILDRQDREGWGAKVVDRLARDLKIEFPEIKGFSPRNLKYMRRFAEAWPDPGMVQQLLHKVPWFHLCTLLDKVKDPSERDWYVRATIQYGWSRNVLRRKEPGHFIPSVPNLLGQAGRVPGLLPVGRSAGGVREEWTIPP